MITYSKIVAIFLEGCKSALQLQNADGSFDGGSNGPYGDKETPVRNTSHWLYSFCVAYKITGEQLYWSAATAAASYLKNTYRSGPVVFDCRHSVNKDNTNGVMGQAWAMEGLVKAGYVIKDHECSEIALDIFNAHEFDFSRTAWFTVLLSNKRGKIDRTFNHQLWFCAIGCEAHYQNGLPLPKSINEFIASLQNKLPLYNDGLVRHSDAYFGTTWQKDLARLVYYLIRYKKSSNFIRNKSWGYHLFNTFAFSIIYQYYPELIRKHIPDKAIDLIESKEFEFHLRENNYGFPYNPPGFEAAFTLQTFRPELKKSISRWLTLQIDETYDSESGFFIKGCHDSHTSAARLYELSRYIELMGD